MNRRRSPILAWTLCALALAGTVPLAVLSVRAGAGSEEGGIVLAIGTPIALSAFAIVGALITLRRPDNSIGWLFLATALVFVTGATAQNYSQVTPPLPKHEVGSWIAGWSIDGPGIFTLFVFFLLLFPTGRLPTPRWRHLARLSIVATAGLIFFLAFKPGQLVHVEARNPFAIAALGPLWRILELPLFLGTMACVPPSAVAFVLRFRRSRGVERQQLKWFALAAIFIGLTVGSAPIVFALESLWWLWPVLFITAITSVPVAAGVAILRYRLYDIDRVISRTVSYAIVTVVLAGVFSLLVLLPVVLGVDEAPDYVIAIATLVVAALFRPVRRRVQQAVDHRFNRRRYDTERTIEAFTARLREQVDIDALGAELRSVATRTMEPSHVSLWINGGPR